MSEVKSFKTDSAKQLWRERIIDFVRKHYSPAQVKNLSVLCLAGKEMHEVFEVYDVLGVKRRNIVSLEEMAKEYKAQQRLNTTLDQPITVIHSPVTAYLNRAQSQRFDIVSLDYCGYFDDFKYLDISKLALHGMLGPRAVLITNYQMAREGKNAQCGLRRTGLFVNEHQRLIHASPEEFRQFVLDNPRTVDGDSSLGDLRDITVQATPIAEMHYGTGYWNTHYFKTWLRTQSKDNQINTQRAIEEFNLSLGGENRELLSKLMIDGEPRDVALLMMYFTKTQARSFECLDHEAYKYVSDSRTPMISDFYFFEEERFNFPANWRNSVTYQIKDGQVAIRIKNKKKAQLLLRELNHYHLQMYLNSLNKGAIRVPIERVVLKTNDEPTEVYSPPQEEIKPKEPLLIEPEKKPEPQYVQPEINKEEVYDCIKAGFTDNEIRDTYGLTTMQLAGYKAAVTREDFRLIRDFLREGESPEDIADLFDGKYSADKVSSLKV